MTQSVVFIDASLPDYQTLVAATAKSTEVVLVGAGESGLAKMATWAQTHTGYDSIAIVGHGTDGVQQLGTDRLDSASLGDSAKQALLEKIGTSLTPDGDLLLYGCDVAQGETGQKFVQELAALTGADVAASTDLTGKDGNWTLEYNYGVINADTPLSAVNYAHDLTMTVTSVGSVTLSYDSTLRTLMATLESVHWTYDGSTSNGNGDEIHLTFSGSFTPDSLATAPLSGAYGGFLGGGLTGSLKPSNFGLGAGSFISNMTVTMVDTFSNTYHAPANGLFQVNYYYLKDKFYQDLGGTSSPVSVTASVSAIFNTTPSFVGGSTQTLSYNTSTTAAQDLATYLHVSDTDASQTETWTQQSAPTHGLLTITSATASTGGSGSANITPGGTITYTPTGNYSGSDTFTVRVSDGTATADKTFTVYYNDAPVIGGASGTTAYTEQTPVTVASGITITETADTEWYVGSTGGTLAVQITENSESTDKLYLPTTNHGGNGIWLDTSGNKLMAGATQIGTASAAQVTGSTAWTFTFNASATSILVQAVAQAVQYDDNTDAPSNTSRTVTFTATDAHNYAGTSTVTATQTITVAPVNDAPVGTTGSVTATEDTDYTFSASDFGFTDPDLTTGSNNTLQSVEITTLPASGTVKLNGAAITAGQSIAVADIASLTWTPVADAYGNAQTGLTFKVNDGALADTTARTLSFNVTGTADTPTVTGATTTPNTQTTSGLVLTRNAVDGAEVSYFKITGITNGNLFKSNGTTQITEGSFISYAEGNAGLKFTPTGGGNGSFTAQASTSNADGGLGGSTIDALITVGAAVASPTVNEDTNTGAIAITFGGSETHYKITGITGGTLYSDSSYTTPIANGDFIAKGLNGNATTTNVYFQPTANHNSTTGGNGGFVVQPSTSNADAGFTGNAITSTITLTPVADTPSVTNATTNEDVQNTTGLVISRNAVDGAEVTHFKISGITGGTLYKHDGTTQITNNSFITFAEGDAGLKFIATANTFGSGTFNVEASTNGTTVAGSSVAATITVNPVADTPSVGSTSITEDTDSGAIVITRNAVDGAEVAYYKVTGIYGGTLYSDAGHTTTVSNGSFIASGGTTTNVYFRPDANSDMDGSFTVQGATTNSNSGAGGATATSTITITPVADTPSITNGNTTPGAQTTAGLVISRNADDGNEVRYFKITGITNGHLFKNDGTTEITNNTFISYAEGHAGLRFTANGSTPGSFAVQASLSSNDSGLGGSTATATVSISAAVASVTVNEDTDSGAIPITFGGTETYYKITGISGGTLYSDAAYTTPITNGNFIAQASGGGDATTTNVYFRPTANQNSTTGGNGSFVVQPATSSNGGLIDSPLTSTITLASVADASTVTNTSARTSHQTTSGLVLTRNTVDGAEVAYYKITGITNGSLFKHDGTTAINNGDFITYAEGHAGLKFTPDGNGDGSFVAQASSSSANAGLSGSTVSATITLDNAAPVVDPASGTPADNGTSVSITNDIVVAFPEPLDAGSSDLTKVYLKDVTTDTLVPATVTVNANGQLVINPTGSLAYSTEYYVTWDANALKDGAGNSSPAVTDETTFNFTTADAPAPTGGSSGGTTTTGTTTTTTGNDGSQVTETKKTGSDGSQITETTTTKPTGETVAETTTTVTTATGTQETTHTETTTSTGQKVVEDQVVTVANKTENDGSTVSTTQTQITSSSGPNVTQVETKTTSTTAEVSEKFVVEVTAATTTGTGGTTGSGGTTGTGGTSTDTAVVALYYGDSVKTVAATEVNVPVGVSLTSTGARTPTSNTEAVANLVNLIDTTAGATETNKTSMISGGQSFLNNLASTATSENKALIVNSLTLAANDVPSKPIQIVGAASTVATDNGQQAKPVEAIVIDTRNLLAGTELDLQNVEFAVIVGNNIKIRGGDGQNIVFAGAGTQDIRLGADDDELHAGDGDDSVGSEGGNDKLYGDAGNDTVYGGEGNDSLYGGDGNDYLHGDAGDDLIDGGTGINTASYYTATSAVTVSLTKQGKVQDTLGGGKDTLLNIQNLQGSDFNDVLVGDAKRNTIEGGAGNDTMDGGAGKLDIVSYEHAASGVTVNLSVKTAQNTGGAGTDTVKNVEGVIGSAFADTLTGSKANGYIDGGAGNDTLITGFGIDTLIGGLGADTIDAGSGGGRDMIRYNSAVEGGDTILNFRTGKDKIEFVGSAFGGHATGKLAKAEFVSGDGATAQTEAQKFIFDTTTHSLYFDEDGSGSGAAVLIATVGTATLTASDIVFIV